MNEQTSDEEVNSVNDKKENSSKAGTAKSFRTLVSDLITEINAVKAAKTASLDIFDARIVVEVDAIKSFVEEHIITESETKKISKIDSAKVYEFTDIADASIISMSAYVTIIKSLFTYLVTLWDAYFADVIREIYRIRPNILDISKKSIIFTELISLGSVEEARKYLIDREIDDLMRGSHEEQFDYVSNKIGVKFQKDNDLWFRFIEVTERRNLITHTGGTVSRQYINVCKKNNINIGETKVGDNLTISLEYFNNACDMFSELGMKLGYTVWNKLIKGDSDEREAAMIDIGFKLIRGKQYELAERFINYTLIHPIGYKKEQQRRISIINLPLSYRLQGAKEACVNILSSEDWSASADKFLLACHVLKEEYSQAGMLMTRIGQDGEIRREDYDYWPLFVDFRQTKFYEDAYKAVFYDTVVNIEVVERPADIGISSCED